MVLGDFPYFYKNCITMKETVLGVVRHILTFVGGYMVAKGIIDETTSVELIGGLVTVIGAVWSIIAKKKPAA